MPFSCKYTRKERGMANRIAKAYEMTDAKITFVSLVDKAANKKRFLITKAGDGNAQFLTYGRILKADKEAHYITGVVYEPMVEDTQGNYMTEDEITKAAHWFAKNGSNVDLQHSFEPLEGAAVVESSVAKCDFEIDGEPIRKGTWLMTVEVTDPAVFEAVEKGEITGFSMGGVGQYSQEDVDIAKAGTLTDAKSKEGKGILKRLAGMFGMDVVEKGAVKDSYIGRITSENFWQAFYALQDVLFRWSWHDDRYMPESDPVAIQEALADFNEIVTELLADPGTVAKSVDGIRKAGKKLSAANRDTLKGIHESLGEFLSKFEDEEEEGMEMTKAEMQEIVKAAVAECMGNPPIGQKTGAGSSITKNDIVEAVRQVVAGEASPQGAQASSGSTVTKADVQGMIEAAIRKATGEEDTDGQGERRESLEEAITKAVSVAMEPFMKQAGFPTNLNNGDVQKAAEEMHYLHGII